MTLLIAYFVMSQGDYHPVAYIAVFFLWLCHIEFHSVKKTKE